MKKTSILTIIFLLFNNLSAQYIENFHDCASSFQGYWSCENRKGYELIDISGKNNHGFYKNVKHENGRKGRQYLNWNANIDFVDTNGETRTCLNLNGGYGQVNGICFECDSARYNKLIKFQAYIKRDSNSYGVIASFGDSGKGNGVLIYNSLDSLTFRDSLTVKILSNNNTVKHLTGFLPPNRWFYLKIYIALNKSNTNSVDHIFGQILEDDSGNSDISNYPSSLNNDALPDLGWSGFMCLGKNGFTGQILNKGIWIDDIGIGNTEKGLANPDWDICYDRGVSTKSLKYNALNLYPNPVSDVLNIESANTILREYSQYEIYALDCTQKQSGSLSNSINVHELPPGVYSLKIGPFVSKFVKMN